MRGVLQGDVVSIRNDRFVFAVRAEQRHRVRGLVHGESASGATLFIEPQEIVLRGNELSSQRHRERREITRILAELTAEVRSLRQPLLALFEQLLALDVASAKARFAEAFGCCTPVVTKTRSLRWVEARHPLLLWRERGNDESLHNFDLSAALTKVVPLDLELGDGYHQLVVTGPNTGGKTVVLKVLGLLSLMAYSGIPVPAQSATLPLFDTILADIGDEQSLEQNLRHSLLI